MGYFQKRGMKYDMKERNEEREGKGGSYEVVGDFVTLLINLYFLSFPNISLVLLSGLLDSCLGTIPKHQKEEEKTRAKGRLCKIKESFLVWQSSLT